MQIDLTTKEFRYLLDLVYIGNWVLNSIRGDDRFADYDAIESKLFSLCRGTKLQSLVENWQGEEIPSRAYAEGGPRGHRLLRGCGVLRDPRRGAQPPGHGVPGHHRRELR